MTRMTNLNPSKVLIILEDLGLPYQTILVDGDGVKK
jgi:glutathione S-transferase